MAEDEKQKEEETCVSQQKINLHLYSSKTKVRKCSKVFCFCLGVQENIHLSKKYHSSPLFPFFFRNDKGMLRGRRRIEPRHKKNMKREYWGKMLPMDLWIVYKNQSGCIRLLNDYGIHRD